MNIREIDEGNVAEYDSVIDADVAENMERMYYRGLACHDDDDNICSVMIWELHSVEKETDTFSKIESVYASNSESLMALMEEYHDLAVGEDVVRTLYESTQLDDNISKALASCGFEVKETEGRDVFISMDELAVHPLAKKKAPPFVDSISKLELKSYHQGIMKLLFDSDVSAMEDLGYIPKTWFDQDVSCCVTTDGKVNGFLLVHTFPSGIMMPVLFHATGPDYVKHLAYMMVYSIKQATKLHPCGKVMVRRRNKNVAAMVNKLFPEKKGAPAIVGKREE